MKLAGLFIDNFHKKIESGLSNIYEVLGNSYIKNLSTWYNNENQKISTMVPIATNDSFIPLHSNEALNKYFDQEKDHIVEGIYLCQLFDTYDNDISLEQSDFIKKYKLKEEEFKLKMKKKVKFFCKNNWLS